MKSKLLLLLTAAVLLNPTKDKAQVSACTFSQSSSSYGQANTGTFVGVDTLQDDDGNIVNLPFPFVYNGVSQTTIGVYSNGFLSFITPTLNSYNPISDLATQEVISAFGIDLLAGPKIFGDITSGSNTITNCSSVVGYSVGDVLYDQYSEFGTNPTITAVSANYIVLNTNALTTYATDDFWNLHTYIKQNVTGVTPNRICEFEYFNFARYNIFDESVSFKIRLYETSNKIEFLYGTFVPGSDFTPAEVGLKGTSNSDYNNRSVVSPVPWATSTSGTSDSDNCAFESGTAPLIGQSYMWTPTSCTVPALSVTPSNTLICEGETVVLTAAGATTFSWTNGPNTAQFSDTPLTTTTYTLIGANASCSSSITYVQNVVPSPTLTITQSNSQLCSGQSATLTASGATTYSWNGTAGPAQFIVTPAVTTTYSLSATNGTCDATQTIVQNVAATPTLAIAQSSSLICSGSSATLNASGASSYSWNGVSGTAQFVVSPTVNSTYNLIGSNGPCTATQSIAQNVAPVPTLNITQSSVQICSGQSATLTATGATTYSWNGNSGPSQFIVTPTLTTTYNLVGSNGTCTVQQNVQQKVVDCTGISETSLISQNMMSVYPNPFNTQLTLKNTGEKEVAIIISDAVGKIVYKSKIKGDTTETITSDFLSNGVYFISVKSENGTFTKKLIKE